MNPAARDGYRELLCSQWQSEDCTLPNDPLELAEMSLLGDELWSVHSPRILRNFEVLPNGRLRNRVCFEEWSEAKRIYEARQESAKRTTKVRSPRKKRTVTVDKTTVTDASASRSADTRTVTVTSTETDTKDQKQKQPPSPKAPAFTLPLWVTQSTWDEFELMRKKIRKPMTDRARQNILAKLGKFRERGDDVEEMLNRSITNGWQDVWPMGGNNGGKNQGSAEGNGDAPRIKTGSAYFDSLLGTAGEGG